jgi:AraC family transcriptional regulator
MSEKLAAGSDYGERSIATAIAGLSLVQCEYRRDAQTPSHYHAGPYFGLVLRGGYRELYRGVKLELRRGAVAFHPAEERHSTRMSDEGLRIFRIELGAQLTRRVTEYLPTRPRMMSVEAAATARRMRHELSNADALSPLVLEGLALDLILDAARADRAVTGRWLARVHQRLHDEFATSLSLQSLAETAGVHPTHLARAFRRRYGCTVGEMQRRLRVDAACARLSSTDVPIGDIALDTGFASQSHFTLFFRRAMGITPAAYRRTARSDRDRTSRSRKS